MEEDAVAEIVLGAIITSALSADPIEDEVEDVVAAAAAPLTTPQVLDRVVQQALLKLEHPPPKPRTTYDFSDIPSSDDSPEFQHTYPHFPKPITSQPVGGRLQYFADNWQQITDDYWVLQTVQNGLTWEFDSPPPLSSVPVDIPAHTSQASRQVYDRVIEDDIRLGIIEEVSLDDLKHNPGF